MRALVVIAIGGLLVSCTFPSVTFVDASIPADAASEAQGSDAGADAGDPCDEDNDGYKAEGTCGGTDCNDHDSRVNPGQTQFITDVPDAAPWGDWNCDGYKQPQYPSVSCNLGVACDNAQGFSTSEDCGLVGSFVTCAGLCTKSDAGTRTQGCL